MHSACCHTFPLNPQLTLRYCVIFLLLFALMPRLDAGDLTELQVTETSGVYHIRMVMVVHVPAKYVRGEKKH